MATNAADPARSVDVAKTAEFLGLAFAIAWLSAAVFYLFGIEYGTLTSVVLVAVFFMWAPAFAAIIVQKRRGLPVRAATGLVRGRLRWIVLAWFTPVGLLGATIGLGMLWPGVSFSADYAAYLRDAGVAEAQVQAALAQLEGVPVSPILLFLFQGLLAGLTINAIAALGEELGWRGLLLKELSSLGFWRVSFITGFFWGIWHAPIILQGHNFPESPVAGVAMMTLATVAMAPIYTYMTLRAGSVLAATLLHGSFNGLAALSLVYLTGAGHLVISAVGLAGIAAALVTVAVCVAHDRWLAREPITTGAPLAFPARR